MSEDSELLKFWLKKQGVQSLLHVAPSWREISVGEGVVDAEWGLKEHGGWRAFGGLAQLDDEGLSA